MITRINEKSIDEEIAKCDNLSFIVDVTKKVWTGGITVVVTYTKLGIDGINFGKCKIEIEYYQEGNDIYFNNATFDMIGGTPCPMEEEVIHPYIKGDFFCFGEYEERAEHMLVEGFITDYIELVWELLNNEYGSGGYKTIDDWHATGCASCGNYDEDESYGNCDSCNTDICNNCSAWCESCDKHTCRECASRDRAVRIYTGNTANIYSCSSCCCCSICESDEVKKQCDYCRELFCEECCEEQECEECLKYFYRHKICPTCKACTMSEISNQKQLKLGFELWCEPF